MADIYAGNWTYILDPATGQPVAVASGAATGAVTDAAVTNPASSGSVIALLKGIITKLAGVLSIDSESVKATYSFTNAYNIATAANLILQLQGSASKTIRLKLVEISATNATPGQIQARLVRYSTAATGGTAVAGTPRLHDTNDAAATAVIATYIADPTAGTSVGNLANGFLTTGNGSTAPTLLRFEYGTRNDKAAVLRGTSDFFGINMAALPAAGTAVIVRLEWTEE